MGQSHERATNSVPSFLCRNASVLVKLSFPVLPFIWCSEYLKMKTETGQVSTRY